MSNQTRSFLILALCFVAYLLFMQWRHEYYPPQPPAPTAAASVASAASTAVAGALPTVPSATTNGKTTKAAASTTAGAAASTAAVNKATTGAAQQHGQLITVKTDVLGLTIDSRGGTVVTAHLLKYPKKLHSQKSVRLLSDKPLHFYEAQNGLIGVAGDAAPNHKTLFHATQTSYQLEPGQKQLTVALTWTGPDGVKVVKRYTLTRGSYTVGLSQTIVNNSAATWQGQAYRQLERVKPPEPHYSNFLEKYSDQSRYSFFGVAWYGPKDNFNQIKFGDIKSHPLAQNGGVGRTVKGGWIAMEQNYFVGAWLPPKNETSTFSTLALGKVGQGKNAPKHYLIRSVGPLISVAPGASSVSKSRLFLGPKLPKVLNTVAPHFGLALNYGMMTIIARPLHWVLAKLHVVTQNWGWAIVLLVLLLNVGMYKLYAAQYRSAAHMRRLKPRMDALKERFGDDKRALQQATMEMYKKEKVNPMAGCLPMVVIFPIFFGLYELLRESVELRQAPFIFWIQDLSAPDPYYILPVIFAVAMLLQAIMMPIQPGMSSGQAKMMRYLPVAFAVIYLFFPSGLAIYYIVNTFCRLGIQWWVYRKVDHETARKQAKV